MKPLDLFFTSNRSNYSYTVSSPPGSSDHSLISVSSSFSPPLPIPPTQSHLWHFENTRHSDIRDFLLDFPWGEYCFRSRNPELVAAKVTEVITSGMEAYIPSSVKTFSPSNPWFDCTCYLAVEAEEQAYQSYQASPSAQTHALFISARNHYESHTHRAKDSFHRRKSNRLTFPTGKNFWSLARKISKNFRNSSFPSLICPDGSVACSPTDKATIFGSLFSSNYTISDSNAPEPLTLPLSNPVPSLIISTCKVRRVLHSLKTDKAPGPDGITAKVLKEFADELAPVLCHLFCLILNTCSYPSSWKHVVV